MHYILYSSIEILMNSIMKTKFIIILISICYTLNAYSSVCYKHKEFMKELIYKKDHYTIDDTIEMIHEKDKVENFDLLMLGEGHYAEFNNFYESILISLKKKESRWNCVFIEFWDIRKLIPKCPEKINSLKLEGVLPPYDISSLCKLDSLKKLIRIGTTKQYTRINESQLNMLKAPLRYGYQLYLVDKIYMDKNKKPTNRNEWLLDRDKYMAREIQVAFDSGSCDKGIAINGSSHLSRSTKLNLPKLLKNKKIITGLVVHPGFPTERFGKDKTQYDFKWMLRAYNTSKLVCGDYLPQCISENFAILINKAHAKGVPLIHKINSQGDNLFEGDWSDFDIAFFIGKNGKCITPSQQEKNKSFKKIRGDR